MLCKSFVDFRSLNTLSSPLEVFFPVVLSFNLIGCGFRNPGIFDVYVEPFRLFLCGVCPHTPRRAFGGDDFGGPLPPWSWAGLQSEPDAVHAYGEQNGLLTVEGPFDSPLGTQSGQRPRLFLIRVPLN